MRTVLFLMIAFWAALIASGTPAADKGVARKPWAIVAVSDNGDHIVRIKFGDGKRRAKALTFKFAPAKDTFLDAGQLELRNPVAPERVFVTDDGRFIVTLDDLHEVGRTRNAVVIYDRDRNVSRAFSIEDFLPPRVISKLPCDFGMRLWFTGWAVLDNDSLKLYPSGTSKDPRFPDQPPVVVDIAKMTVRVLAEGK